MSARGTQPRRWVLKIVPVANGYDVYSESPVLAFYRHARTLEEAQTIAARQPTREETVRMLLASA
jgi:hypothetical protein